MSARKRTDPPYWVRQVAEQICVSCGHGYVIEAGFHCSACDEGVCGECVLVAGETGERFCVTCLPQAEEAAG